jgi:Mrp family chromosome partitioning ATPase
VLQLPNVRGIADLLSGNANVEEVIDVDPDTGLHFMAAGRTVKNPAFQLESTVMRDLIEGLSKRYETVVLDSAPLLPVSDTKLILRYADRAVMVLRWEETNRDAVRLALGFLRQAHAKVAGVVINGVVAKKHASYGFSDSHLYRPKQNRKYYRPLS